MPVVRIISLNSIYRDLVARKQSVISCRSRTDDVLVGGSRFQLVEVGAAGELGSSG